MSRRYGRNQRRRAREALAASEAEIQSLKRQLVWTREDLRKEKVQRRVLATQMAACSEALGMSIAVPPKPMRVDILHDVARYGFQMAEETEALPITPSVDMSNYAMQQVSHYTMDVIEAHLETTGYGPLGKHPHAMLTVNGQQAYAVRLQDLGELLREEGIQRIANLLATEFIDSVRRMTLGARSPR
ncbi:hypothetical protein [Pseudacidovorax intermedius]|uniref:hypothetical protein n=1 Tax=Pseudacidovorax intermedius TaxID=433924 RepID=UPI0026EC2D31|nr:hypothetical protein [Pseudacidovorax intermedius]